MDVPEKSYIFCLFGFILLFNGVLTMPNLIHSKDVEQPEAPGVVVAKPNLIQSKDLVQDRTVSNLKYPINYQVYFNQATEKNFTGFRSVFQWTIGKTFNKNGIHNAMEFVVDDSLNGSSQVFGQVGIYSKGSEIGVQLSLGTVWIGFSIYSNQTVISNAIYFLDVEINDNTLTGYISGPQRDLTHINDTNLTRHQLGKITWINKLTNLSLDNYFVANSYESCDLVSDISTFNYLPKLYNKAKSQKVDLRYSVLYNSRMCGPTNTLAMTNWDTVLYISRPTPVFNATSSFQ
ncbi:hypothetical protein ACLKA7_004619 [Drosophila subpalustris]